MHARLVMTVAVVAFAAAPAPLYCDFCECGEVPPGGVALREHVRARLAEVDAVFVGKVERTGGGFLRRPYADFRVSRWWKGKHDVDVRVVLRSARSVSSCDLVISEGEEWLMFAARRTDGTLGAYQCNGSTVLTKADSTLAALGPGTAPRTR